MPNELPYLPFFVGDFMVTVSTWPPDRVGAYWLALCYQWEQGGVPADDERELAGVMHTSRRHALRLWASIRSKFRRHGDGLWWNPRLEKVRIAARAQVEVSSARGKRGAAARWGKGALVDVSSNAQALHAHNSGNGISEPESEPNTPPLPPSAEGGRAERKIAKAKKTREDAEALKQFREERQRKRAGS